MEEVIYFKKYPSGKRQYEALMWGEPNPSEKRSDEFYRELAEGTGYVEIPGRAEKSQEFIDLAINISKSHRYDIVVRRLRHLVAVDLSFDAPAALSKLTGLIGMADEMSLFTKINDRDVTLALDFYTHAVCSQAEKPRPAANIDIGQK